MGEVKSISKAIAARLKLARETAGLSQGQVAKKLAMHRPTVSEIEAGNRKVSAEELVEFSKLYGVSISWLTVTDSEESQFSNARIQLAAREMSKIKPEDLDKLLRILRTLKTEEK